MGRHERRPQKYLYGFRGRMDERYDMVRSVRDQRYVYIRNYMPHLIYGQHVDYMFQTPTTQVWKALYDEGKLRPPQTFFWEPKPAEELYDLQTDPDEVRNLAGSPEHQAVLDELRQAQREHVLAVRDVGFLSEAEMHRRAAGTTIYELGHDPQQYPLERILAMAATGDFAGPGRIGRFACRAQGRRQRRALLGGSRPADPRPERGRSGRRDLRGALKDDSPTVRIVAARALGQYGNAEDLQPALAVLEDAASPEKNGAYASILALNAIDALGDKAASLTDRLKMLPDKDPAAPGRANGYVSRLLEKILGPRPAEPAAKPNGARPRNRLREQAIGRPPWAVQRRFFR